MVVVKLASTRAARFVLNTALRATNRKHPKAFVCRRWTSALCFKYSASGCKPQTSDRILFLGGRSSSEFLPACILFRPKKFRKPAASPKRTRSAVACARCKASKKKCNDYRPCKQCTDSFNICHKVDMQGSKLASSNKTIKREYDEHVSRPLTSSLQIRSEKRIENLQNVNHTSFPERILADYPLPMTRLNLYSTGCILQKNAQTLSPLSHFMLEDFSIGRPLAIQPPPNLPLNLYVPFSEPTFLRCYQGLHLSLYRWQKACESASRRRRFLPSLPTSSAFSWPRHRRRPSPRFVPTSTSDHWNVARAAFRRRGNRRPDIGSRRAM